MQLRSLHALLLFVVLALVACFPTVPPAEQFACDQGGPCVRADASSDAGLEPDATTNLDAEATFDADPSDLAGNDLGPGDKGVVDVGPRDTGSAEMDAEVLDTGADAGVQDGACRSYAISVQGDIDDGEISETLQLLMGGESGTIFAGAWSVVSGFAPTYGYFRFVLPEALDATSGFEARLRLLSLGTVGTWDNQAHGLVIRLEDTADAAPPVFGTDSPASPTGRPMISGSVRWPAAGGLNWPNGATQRSPDLAALLRTLATQRAGLLAGAHVQLWLTGDQLDLAAEAGAVDFSVNPLLAAVLELDFHCQ